MWAPTPNQPPFSCAVCHAGSEAGPFWRGPRVHHEGQLGPQGLVFSHIEICAGCMFLAINHPDSPHAGKIPKVDELAARVTRAESGWSQAQMELAAVQAEVRRLLAEGSTPEAVSTAAVAAAIAELAARGILPEPDLAAEVGGTTHRRRTKAAA